MIIDVSTIIPAMACILYVFFAAFGFIQSKKTKFYWSFQIYVVAIVIWSFGSMMMHLNSGILTPLLWNRIMLVGLLSVPFLLIHSVVDIMGLDNRKYRILVTYSYLLIIPLMILNFLGKIVTDVGFTDSGKFFYILGEGAILAYSISYIFLIVTLIIMGIESKNNNDSTIRKNLKLPLLGTVIMLVGILGNLVPVLGVYPIDILAAGINAILLFYTIYRYKLFAYSQLAMKVMLVLVLSVAATIIYYLIILMIRLINPAITPSNILPLSILLGVVTALIISPLRNLMNYFVDKVIIPRRHPYQAAIHQLSQKLVTIIDLNQLGSEIVGSLTDGLKASWAIFIVEGIKVDSGIFYLQSNKSCPTDLQIGDPVELNFPQVIQSGIELAKKRDISSLIFSERRGAGYVVSDQLPPAELIIPLVYRNQISGYIISGYPESKNYISQFEIDALDILASQCALSLKNALSFTQIKVQGEELNMTNSKLEAIFNGIALPVSMIDVDYTILEVNNAATLFFGKSREKMIGKKCYRVFFSRNRPCTHCRALDCIHAGGMIEIEAEVKKRIFNFQFNNVRVPQNQKMVFIEICKDVTEQKHLQEDLVRTEKMAGIGTLAAGIAHELNNPLAGIAGTAEIILAELDEDSNIREFAEDILTYSMNAADVIKELSVYTRKEKKELQDVDIVRILEFSLRLATRGMETQALTIVRNYHALPQLKAHESELQQIFLNLIVNAIQAMGGKGTLAISCLEESGSVHIEIEDTGCGISQEHLNQIFTPFFTTKPPGTGTGLGLSNCFNIVNSMSGRIRVRSEVNAGSTFTIIIPITEVGKTAIRFTLVTSDHTSLNDILYLQRKVLIGEKGYIEESIQTPYEENALHILAYRGIHPVGTVSLLPSVQFWPLPVGENFPIEKIIDREDSGEIIRLAVLPEARNTTVSVGLIMLVYLLAKAVGVKRIVIDVFRDDLNTIHLYKRFGFVEVGEYYSPAAVTVLLLDGNSTMEQDEKKLNKLVRPLYKRLIPMFDFGEEMNEKIIDEMKKIVPLGDVKKAEKITVS